MQQHGQSCDENYKPDLDDGKIDPVECIKFPTIRAIGKEHFRKPDVDQIIDRLAGQTAFEAVKGALPRRGEKVILNRHRRISVIHAKLSSEYVVDTVVVMFPAPVGMQRRQEGNRANDTIEPAHRGEAPVRCIMAHDCKKRNRQSGNPGEGQLCDEMRGCNRAKNAKTVKRKVARKYCNRKIQPPPAENSERALPFASATLVQWSAFVQRQDTPAHPMINETLNHLDRISNMLTNHGLKHPKQAPRQICGADTPSHIAILMQRGRRARAQTFGPRGSGIPASHPPEAKFLRWPRCDRQFGSRDEFTVVSPPRVKSRHVPANVRPHNETNRAGGDKGEL